jgi:serine/threonine-protein kinase
VVCFAVLFALARGVVHRDLKPSNIMLGDYGEVYVLDWGVARVLEDGPELPESGDKIPSLGGQTQTGELLGTPGYMAPQVRGVDVGPPVDVCALGSICSDLSERRCTRGATYSRARSAWSNVTGNAGRREIPQLDSVCNALATEPSARPTARALGDRIQSFLDGDRDLVARRQHAAKLVTSGRSALLGGQRAEAVHIGGRALALDPSSDEAAELVMSLVLRPPDELPGELVADLRAVERRQNAAAGPVPYLVPFARCAARLRERHRLVDAARCTRRS